MNKRLSLLTAALLLTGASSAFAASSTDLTVTGIITPGVCTPSLANGGVVDYGKKSAKDLSPTRHTPLGVETIQLTVNCDASTQFALKASDNRAGSTSAGGASTFGLGLINTNEKLGFYQLSFMNPVADTPVTALYSRNMGDTWNQLEDDIGITSADWVAFGNNPGSVWTPDFIQNITVDIAVNTHIAPANSLTLTDEVTLDGSATLQIEYL